jgi:hypothetical protein
MSNWNVIAISYEPYLKKLPLEIGYHLHFGPNIVWQRFDNLRSRAISKLFERKKMPKKIFVYKGYYSLPSNATYMFRCKL